MIGEHSSGNSTILARLNCKMLPLFRQMIAHRWGEAQRLPCCWVNCQRPFEPQLSDWGFVLSLVWTEQRSYDLGLIE
jgi:hypothetical protein